MAIKVAAILHNVGRVSGRLDVPMLAESLVYVSPFKLGKSFDLTLCQSTTRAAQFEGALYGTLPYQVFGYGTGSVSPQPDVSFVSHHQLNDVPSTPSC